MKAESQAQTVGPFLRRSQAGDDDDDDDGGDGGDCVVGGASGVGGGFHDSGDDGGIGDVAKPYLIMIFASCIVTFNGATSIFLQKSRFC